MATLGVRSLRCRLRGVHAMAAQVTEFGLSRTKASSDAGATQVCHTQMRGPHSFSSYLSVSSGKSWV